MVKDAQYLPPVRPDAVRQDVGSAQDDQFLDAFEAARSSQIGKLGEPLGRVHDPQHSAYRSPRIVLGNVGFDLLEVGRSAAKPPNLQVSQANGP